MWEDPGMARFLDRVASISRLIVFDRRGTGLSDPVPIDDLPSLEVRMDDVMAVIDAVGSDDVAGLAVHIASRISAIAGPSQVLVSRTVEDLVAGSRDRVHNPGQPYPQRCARPLGNLRCRWETDIGPTSGCAPVIRSAGQ